MKLASFDASEEDADAEAAADSAHDQWPSHWGATTGHAVAQQLLMEWDAIENMRTVRHDSDVCWQQVCKARTSSVVVQDEELECTDSCEQLGTTFAYGSARSSCVSGMSSASSISTKVVRVPSGNVEL